MSKVMRSYFRDVSKVTKRIGQMQKITNETPIKRETIVSWAKKQIELERGRLEYKGAENNVRAQAYLDGKVAAFEKVVRVFNVEG